MMRDHKYAPRISNDIWAIGILFIKLLNGNAKIYSSIFESDILQEIENGYLLSLIPDYISDRSREIFAACLKT